MSWVLGSGVLLALFVALALVVFTMRTMQWGATLAERTASMPGDDTFGDKAAAFVAMTRAISIQAPPQAVWPWLAQCGRGAGWYSLDQLDNGGRRSAEHLVSWVPPPRLGDATAVGYLRRVDSGAGLTWWSPGGRFFGADARLVVDIQLRPEGEGSRLVIRMSADTSGPMARPALWMFELIDGLMARRQLLTLRERAERRDARSRASEGLETGSRDQYQYYEVIYASGERAGVPGKEQAARWRAAARADGVLTEEELPPPRTPKRKHVPEGQLKGNHAHR